MNTRLCIVCDKVKPYVLLSAKQIVNWNGKLTWSRKHGDGVMKTPWHGRTCPTCKKVAMAYIGGATAKLKALKESTSIKKGHQKGICPDCNSKTVNYRYCPPCHSRRVNGISDVEADTYFHAGSLS